jgi:type III secretory pathway component EscS
MSKKLVVFTRFFASRPAIIITGAIIGLLVPLLQKFSDEFKLTITK